MMMTARRAHKQISIPLTAARVGRDLGQELEVVEGLSGNEQVVTNPGERLKDGIEVEIAPRKDQPVTPAKTETAQR